MITNILFKKWQKVYKKHLTSTALCGIINITKGEESPKKRKEEGTKALAHLLKFYIRFFGIVR